MTMSEMRIQRAIAIFEHINNDAFAEDEKALAIHAVMNMPVHMSITKDSMVSVIKYLWDKTYEILEKGE